MGDFSFIHPQWLLAALPLALLLPWIKNGIRGSGLIAPHLAKLLSGADNFSKKNKHWPIALLAVAWLFSIIALAGPSWQKREMPAISLEGARVLVMDMSRSMYATDILPNRLTQARFKALDMLPGWKEGSTGLVTYAADGYIISPLTEDAETLKALIPSLSPNIMPIPGSNAAAGVQQAIDLLKQAGFAQGDIIIISDGMTGSESTATLAAVKNTRYRVSILAIGTQEGAPIRLPDGRLLEQYGKPIITKLALNTLSPVTQKTGGILQMWQPTNRDVDNIIAYTATPQGDITQQSKIKIEEKINDGFWLLFPVIILALFGFRRGVVLSTLVMLLPTQPVTAAPFKTDDQTAYQQFQTGEYQQAAAAFQSPAWKGIAQYKAGDYQGAIDTLSTLSDPTSRYNLGNAYAQAGDLKAAKETYETLLKTDADNEDAKNNLKVIEEALKQQQQQQKESQDQQNKDGSSKDNQPQDQQEKQDQQGEQGEQGKQGEQGEQGKQGEQSQDQQKDPKDQNEGKENEQQSKDQQNNQQDGKSKPSDQQPGQDPQQKNQPQPNPATSEQNDIANKEQNEASATPEPTDLDTPEKTEEQAAAAAQKEGSGEENKDGLTASHPVLKKLEQVPDNTAGLIQAQLYLQAQQKEKPKPTENTW